MVLIGKSISEDFLIFAYYMKIKLTLELTLGNHYKEYKHHYTQRERERERTLPSFGYIPVVAFWSGHQGH
jgi:hypothetical protein